jgi:hypothetical protein
MVIPALEFPSWIRTLHLSIFNQKKVTQLLEYVQRYLSRIQGPKVLVIPDPDPDPQHWILLSSSFPDLAPDPEL